MSLVACHKSVDAGDTFATIEPRGGCLTSPALAGVRVSRDNEDTVWVHGEWTGAGGEDCLVLTNDGGATFSDAQGAGWDEVTACVLHGDDEQEAVVTEESAGPTTTLERTVDSGANWAQQHAGLPATLVSCLHRVSVSTLELLVGRDAAVAGNLVWHSRDRGVTWFNITDGVGALGDLPNSAVANLAVVPTEA